MPYGAHRVERCMLLCAVATCLRRSSPCCKLLQHAAVPCKHVASCCNMLQYRASTVQRVQMQIEDGRFDEYAKEVIDEYRTAVFPLHSPLPRLHRDWARPCHICTGTGLTPSSMSTAQRYRQFTCSHAPTQAALSLTKIEVQTRADACTSCSACVRPAPCACAGQEGRAA